MASPSPKVETLNPSPAIEEKVAEKVDHLNLPCPLPYEAIHLSQKPYVFEGFHLDLAKRLSPQFALTHSVSMGPTEVPSQSSETYKIPTAQYWFGATFLNPKMMLAGSVLTDGRLSARAKWDFSDKFGLNAQARLSNDPHESDGVVSFDYKGADHRAQFQLGAHALFRANYIQSVAPNFSLGGEIFWNGQYRKSGIGYAGRYNTDKMVAAGKVGNGIVGLSYVQKVSEKVSLATDFEYNYLTENVTASVGYDLNLRQAHLRGNIDSNGRASACLEEHLGAGLRFLLSAEIDHMKKNNKFGYGLSVGQ